MRAPSASWGVALVIVGAVAACGCTSDSGKSTDPAATAEGNGMQEPGGSTEGMPAGMGSAAGSEATLCTAGSPLQVGVTRLRRLTRSQFDNTVRDLLGIDGDPAAGLAPDERIGPFDSNAIAPITDLLVQQHAEVAQSLALQAQSRMNEIAGCDLGADTGNACALTFIEDVGKRAYRRPLESGELAAYASLYELGRQQGAQSGFRLVVEAMLQSPFFLYHSDAGNLGAPSAAAVPLTGFELASRLSYFLWNSMPDEALFARAEDGSLNDIEVLKSEVDRMLGDPRATGAIPLFHLQWLGIGDMAGVAKDPEQFATFDANMVDAMLAETANFADYVVRKGDGLMSTLLTADFSLLEGPLFELYGVSPPPGFSAGDPVALNPAERAGILTQPAFLTSHAHRDQTSPVHRGLFVRENILCQPIPPPPPDVNPSPPAPTPGTTMRERIAAHQSVETCASCHRLMDGIGLGFESYDAIGVFRSEEDNRPVDATGNLLATGDPALDGPFEGAVDLAHKLAASPVVAECLARQWFRFALGRVDSRDDQCSIRAMNQGFASSGGNVRELLLSIVTSEAFRNVRLVGVEE